jgi:hypothetical protein
MPQTYLSVMPITSKINEGLANSELGSTAYFTCNTLWTFTWVVISEESPAGLLVCLAGDCCRTPTASPALVSVNQAP